MKRLMYFLLIGLPIVLFCSSFTDKSSSNKMTPDEKYYPKPWYIVVKIPSSSLPNMFGDAMTPWDEMTIFVNDCSPQYQNQTFSLHSFTYMGLGSNSGTHFMAYPTYDLDCWASFKVSDGEYNGSINVQVELRSVRNGNWIGRASVLGDFNFQVPHGDMDKPGGDGGIQLTISSWSPLIDEG